MKVILIHNTANRLNSDCFTHVSLTKDKLFKGSSYNNCLKKVLKFQSYDKDARHFYARSVGYGHATWGKLFCAMVYQAYGKNKKAVAKEYGYKEHHECTWELFVKVPSSDIQENEDGTFTYLKQEELNKYVDEKLISNA